MRRLLILPLATLLLHAISCSNQDDSFRKLNAQAASEYLEQIRPGGINGQPFWNEYSDKFTYAPSFFNIEKVDGADSYRFDFWLVSTFYRNSAWPLPYAERALPAEKLAQYEKECKHIASFTSKNPQASLSPVWNSLPVGYIGLVVTALDSQGKEIALAGTREFLRDFPFEGPYEKPSCTYEEAAYKALLFANRYKVITHCKENDIEHIRKSPTFPLFACKFLSATICTEILLAKMNPERADEYMNTAYNAASWLISHSQSADAPLAYFPPTYYSRAFEHEQTMSMEPVMVVNSMLDLYEYTHSKEYFNYALDIMRTYNRIVDANGFVAKRLDVKSGKGVTPLGAHPGSLMLQILRLRKNYGIHEFDSLLERCEKFMNESALTSFDMSGQFEDTRVKGFEPYQNMTNIMPNQYVQYLLQKENPSDSELNDARDILRFIEDQFVHWDLLCQEDGLKRYFTPGVYEQYRCAVTIDGSAANTALSYMDWFTLTGDRLALEKARALVDAIVRSQNPVTGEIPTFWNLTYISDDNFWVNCSIVSVNAILRMKEILENLKEYNFPHKGWKSSDHQTCVEPECNSNSVELSHSGLKNGDEVFGWNMKGEPLAMRARESTMELIQGKLSEGDTLYMIYYPGKELNDIKAQKLPVNVSAKAHGGSPASPVFPMIKCATARIVNGKALLSFEEQVALFNLSGASGFGANARISRIILSGEGIVSSGTIRVVDGHLKLVPEESLGRVIVSRPFGESWIADASGRLPCSISIVTLPSSAVGTVTCTANTSNGDFETAVELEGKGSSMVSSTTTWSTTETVGCINEYESLPAGSCIPIDNHVFTLAGVLPGEFSVSPSRKVHFSRGNLVWNGEYFTMNPEQTTHPLNWTYNESPHFYCVYTPEDSWRERYVESDDKGELFACNGKVLKKWTVLSPEEWMYLLGCDGNQIRKGKCITKVNVAGQSNCIVLYPDSWKDKKVSEGDSATYSTKAKWREAERKGAVCLSPAGYRIGSIMYAVGSEGYYRSSGDLCISFSSKGMTLLKNKNSGYAYSIRMVTPAKRHQSNKKPLITQFAKR